MRWGAEDVKNINGIKHFSLPEAALKIGVSHPTLYRWVTQPKFRSRLAAIGVPTVLRDTVSGDYYLSEASVEKLKHRYVRVS